MATVTSASEQQQIVVWRLDRALELGFSLRVAGRIATEDVDLHRLSDLIGAGCPRLLAYRILAPLEGER